MSTHDGKAVIGADRLRYLMLVIDGHPVPLASDTAAAQTMGATEDRIQPVNADALYDAIEDVLLHHRLHAWVLDEDGEDHCPLVDRLCEDGAKSVESGRHEIRLKLRAARPNGVGHGSRGQRDSCSRSARTT